MTSLRTVYLILGSLNGLGGVEREGLAYIEALKENGFKVILASLSKTNWTTVEKIFGPQKHFPDEEIVLRFSKINFLNLYQNLFVNSKFNSLFKKNSIKINIHADMVPIPSDIAHPQDPVFGKNWSSKNVFWNYYPNLPKALYFMIHQFIHTRMIKSTLASTKTLVSNSTFAQKALTEWIKRDSIVIHPPIEVEKYFCNNFGDRENIVISCGRFAPEKNQKIIPLIAQKLPDVKFFIIGSTRVGGVLSKTCVRVVKEIENEIRNLKLNNVKVLTNLSFIDQTRLYRKGKIFLHTAPVEHFGMAVVEGMASGLVPLVYADGGPWNDIIDQGKFGLGYSTVDDAVNNLEQLFSNNSFYERLRDLSIQRSETFSKTNFKKKVISLINNL